MAGRTIGRSNALGLTVPHVSSEELKISLRNKQPENPAPGAGATADVRALFNQCAALERTLDRKHFGRLKSEIACRLTFGGLIFDVFAALKRGSGAPDFESAAKYELLHKLFDEATDPDDRLVVYAQWQWAEFGVTPEDSLGKALYSKLTAPALKRINKMPWNDFYYAQLVRIWLPYIERLLEEGKHLATAGGPSLELPLKRLGYEQTAIAVLVEKKWRSAEELTFEWLASRGSVTMVKRRSDPDVTSTLRNAYSRVFGIGAPRHLTCIFCGKPATSEFHTGDHTTAHHCEDHRQELLPTSRSIAWVDAVHRRWWRNGDVIVIEPSPTDAA